LKISNSQEWTFHEKIGVLEFKKNTIKNDLPFKIFDLDHTVIKTKSGKQFPVDENDWTWKFKKVPETLSSYKYCYNLVIVTNQGGMKKGAKDYESKRTGFKKKIEEIFKEINQVHVIISFESNLYRKPAPGVEKFILENSETDFIPENSLFIGDAAGRAAKDGYKKDFASSDYQFALNIGVDFATPEKYFLDKETRKSKIGDFDPRLLKNWPIFDYSPSADVVILTGYPGSGKSSLSKDCESLGYTRICQDELKTKKKCETEAEKVLKSDGKVIIDRTHSKKADRQTFLDIAKKNSKSVEIIWIDYTLQHAMHNDAFRAFTEDKDRMGKVTFFTFRKYFEEPEIADGYFKITKVGRRILKQQDNPLYYKFLIS